MIDLNDYRKFWERVVADRLPEGTRLLPVTIDREMGKKIQALAPESLTLLMLPPMAKSSGKNVDSFREEADCVVFLMRKYNPQRVQPWDVLADVLPAVEAMKRALLEGCGSPCSRMRLDMSSIETAPETELYGTFAGWSVSFSLIS